MDKKLQKGMYGFHNKKKKNEIIKTVIFFGITLAIYFTGLIHTGSNKNLLTIVAIVGVLPASKAAVSMFMFVRYKAAPLELHEKLQQLREKEQEQISGLLLYDLIFVLNEKVVKTDCIYLNDTSVIVYVENTAMLDADISKYLKNFLSNQGKGNLGVKVCRTQKAFLEQVKTRMHMEMDEKAQENQKKIRDMLFGFSM